MLYGEKKMWRFVSTGNDFLLARREVQVAALEKYNRELRNGGASELQIGPANLVGLL